MSSILCEVCKQPSAIFTNLDGILSQSVRLAKTMIRISDKGSGAKYVHENPCLEVYKQQKTT